MRTATRLGAVADDEFPKIALVETDYIGDGYPLCTASTYGSTIDVAAAATNESEAIGNLHSADSTASQLYQALCQRPSGGAQCGFPPR